MKRIIITLVGLLAAGVWMSAGAQETMPIPEGAVFTASGPCKISPDESRIAVSSQAVFSLPAGERLYDIKGLPEYNKDGRYLLAQNTVYNTQTGERLLELPNPSFRVYWGGQEGMSDMLFADSAVYSFASGQAELHLSVEGADYIQGLSNGDFTAHRSDLYPREDKSLTAQVYDGQTLDLIVDTAMFGVPIAYPSFSSDYSRIAIGNVGVFTYPAMELLYPLPTGAPTAFFSLDSSTVVAFNTQGMSPTQTYHLIDAQTGQTINTLSFPPTSIAGSVGGIVLAYDRSKIAVPYEPTSPSDQTSGTSNLSIIDLRTGAVLQVITGNYHSVQQELLNLEGMYPPRPPQSSYGINGRTVVGRAVVDVETREPVWLSEGGNIIQLTAHYVVTRPCTVWVLP